MTCSNWLSNWLVPKARIDSGVGTAGQRAGPRVSRCGELM